MEKWELELNRNVLVIDGEKLIPYDHAAMMIAKREMFLMMWKFAQLVFGGCAVGMLWILSGYC